MYTIAICDPSRKDADNLRLVLHNVLDRLKIAHIIYYHKDSSSLHKVLKKYPEKYNFLFLEADLSASSNGIELARRLRQDKFEGNIAYLTKNMDYVFDGYDVGACQYLLKPADEEQLHRLFFRLSLVSLQQQSAQYLLLNYGATYRRIRYSDIHYIDTASRKVNIHTKDDVITYPCKLSEMEELLPTDLFLRCHQSFIVQINAVDHLTRAFAVLTDGTEIPISRSYKTIVQSAFSQ